MLICNAFYRQGQKSTFNSTEFNIYEDKYLSQDLTSILHNTLESAVGERRGGGGVVTPPRQTVGGRREPASLLSPGHSEHRR